MKKPFGLWLGLGVLLWGLPPLWAVNNDGKTDIYWRNYSTGANVAWTMDGVSYGSSVTLPTLSDTGWKQVGTGDFNKDGDLDILWRHATSGLNGLWLMAGPNCLYAAYLQPLSDTNWTVVATGYFDGPTDTNIDILCRNMATGDNAIWFMDGTQLVSTTLLQEVPDLSWKVGGTGDFNNDGYTDIVWRHATTGVNYVWYMQGSNLVTTAQLQSEADTNWELVRTGYFSGLNDNTVDLLWRHKTSGDNGIWQMNGVSFVSAHSVAWASTSRNVGGTGDSKVDTDDDDLPDLWERKWFGNLSPGANDNPDGDSLTNLQEFQAGTDPLVAGGIPALAEAVDNLELIFTTGGTASWYVDSEGYIGDDHAQSGSGQSWMETKAVGPGTLGFNCLVSSYPDAGYLRIDLNGSEYGTIAGGEESGWESSGRVTVSLSSGTNTVRWTFVLEWAEEGYDNAASVDYVTVDRGGGGGSVSLGEALDNTSLTWSTGGYTAWSGQTSIVSPFGGGDAAQSGTVSPGQESYLYTSVTGPGLVSFYWKLSAISGNHALRFKVDWSEVAADYGSAETDWLFRSFSIGSGTHTVSWHYTESSDYGQEAEYGWVDRVRFEPDSDIDGLPDTWETQFFGGTSSQNGSGDFDADGLTNLQEYLQATNPTLAELRVKIHAPRWNSLLP